MEVVYKSQYKKKCEVNNRTMMILNRKYNPYVNNNNPEQKPLSKFFLKSSKYGWCILEAYWLKKKNNNQGKIYWVKEYSHAYYVENVLDLNAIGKNQKDNGYEGFPKLTVRQILKKGEEMKKQTLEDYLDVIIIN